MQPNVCTFALVAVLVLCKIDLTCSFRDMGFAAARSVHVAKLQLPSKASPLTATAMSGGEAGAAAVPVPVPLAVPVLETLVQGLDQPVKSGLHINIRGMVLNLWGILSAVVLAVALAVFPLICLCSLTSEMTGDGKGPTFT